MPAAEVAACVPRASSANFACYLAEVVLGGTTVAAVILFPAVVSDSATVRV